MLWPVSINQLHSLRMSRYPKQVKPFEKWFFRVFNWVYSILSYFFHIWTHDNHSLFWWLAQHFGSYTIKIQEPLFNRARAKAQSHTTYPIVVVTRIWSTPTLISNPYLALTNPYLIHKYTIVAWKCIFERIFGGPYKSKFF